MTAAKRQLLVVVKNRFWDMSIGSSVRISLLLDRLAEDFEIEIFCLRHLSAGEREEIGRRLPGVKLKYSFPQPWPLGTVVAAAFRWLIHRPDPERPAASQPQSIRDWKASCALAGVLKRGRHDVVLFEYIWAAKYLNAANFHAMPTERWLDTIDVMHQRHASSKQAGIPVKSPLTAEAEAAFFRDFTRLIAIQEDEAEELRRMAPDKEVVTMPVVPRVDRGVHPRPVAYSDEGPILLHVSSRDPIAVSSLRWFLETVWLEVLAACPAAQLHVLGSIDGEFQGECHPNAFFHGFVQRTASFYRHATLAINPCLAGSGLKIKTVEALAYDLPVVTTDFGAQGIPRNQAGLLVCEPEDFFGAVVRLLEDVPLARSASA